jgi:CHAT domain
MTNSFNISGSNIVNLNNEGKLKYKEASSQIRNTGNMGANAQLPTAPTANSQQPSKTILILAANPKGTRQLRLDEEVREIEAGLQQSGRGDFFKLEPKWAVRTRDIQRSLLELKPQIVHFSGHGGGEHGLVLEDEKGQIKFVNTEALAALFKLFADCIECVVLNACYSEVQADAIAIHIPYVIGMNQAIADKAAIEFSVSFYDALAAGESVEFAYKLGCAAIRMAGIEEHLIPVLKRKAS